MDTVQEMLQNIRRPPSCLVVTEVGIEDLALAVRANPGNRIVVCFRISLFAGLDGVQSDQNTEFGTVVSFVLVNFIGKGKLLVLESLV